MAKSKIPIATESWYLTQVRNEAVKVPSAIDMLGPRLGPRDPRRDELREYALGLISGKE